MEKDRDLPSNSVARATGRSDSHELDSSLGRALEEKPIWAGLYESIRDVLFPAKLPPLELASTPIPVADRMAVKPNPWAIGISGGVNGMIVAALLCFGARLFTPKPFPKPPQGHPVDLSEWIPDAIRASIAHDGGGGGGERSLIDPIIGRNPKFATNPITPPQVETVDKPLLPMESAIALQTSMILPDNPQLPNIGVNRSANVTLLSGGPGGPAGIGTGDGGRDGPGHGPGWGPGTSPGIYKVGTPYGVSEPIPINRVEAEFSDEARRSKYQGVCLIQVIVDAQGNPWNPRVVRSLGMGLDEKALEAVHKYKFKPAMKDGKTPVAVMIVVEVNFRLY